MDPLEILKRFVKDGRLNDVSIDQEYISFGDEYRWPASTQYLIQRYGQERTYRLDEIVFAASRSEATTREYIDEARVNGYNFISLVHKKELDRYLSGQNQQQIFQLVDRGGSLQQENQARQAEGDDKEKYQEDNDANAIEDEDIIYFDSIQLREPLFNMRITNREINFKIIAQTLLQEVKSEREVRKEERKRQYMERKATKHRTSSHHSSMQRTDKSSAAPKVALPVGDSSNRYHRPAPADKKQDALLAAAKDTRSGQAPNKPSHPSQQPGSNAPYAQHAQPQHNSSQKRPRPSQPHQRDDKKHRGHVASHQQAPKHTNSYVPIIIVPQSGSLVDAKNVIQLLESHNFIESKLVTERPGKTENNEYYFRRKANMPDNSYLPRYQILTRVTEPRDWKRVVAVICNGKLWQFKDWPYEGASRGDPVVALQKVRAFYFKYADDRAVPDFVKNYGVKVLNIARSGRHQDVVLVKEFFDELDAFLRPTRHLRYK